MKVKDVMSNSPQYVLPSTTIREAADQMRIEDIGFLPIGENDRLVGVITDRDITIRAMSKGDGVAERPVAEFMSKNVDYCFEEDSLADAANVMCENQRHRLIVLDKDKRVRGVLSTGDIAVKAQDNKLCGNLLEKICQGIK